MTTIKSITTTGLKTRSSRIDLGRATLIQGPVGSGKTAIADAIQFAALGCVPRVGRNEAATARMMRGSRMACEIALDDGRWLSRELSSDGARLKGAAASSWAERKAKATEIGEAIRSLFGAGADAAEENLDIMRLLGRSGAELAKTIEAILDAGGLDEARRVARALDLINARLDSERKKADGLLQPIPPAVARAWAEIAAKLSAAVAASIVKAIDWANDEKLRASAGLREKIAARGQLEDRVAATARPAESAASLRERQAEAERRRTELTTQIELHARASRDRAEAEAAIERAVGRAQEAATASAQAHEALARVDELQGRLGLIAEPDEVLAPVYREARGLPGDPGAPDVLPVPDPIDTRKEWFAAHTARAAVERAEGDPWREVEAATKAIDLLAGDDLTRPHLDALYRLAREHGGDVDALLDAATTTSLAFVQAEERAKEREVERKRIEAQNTANREAWNAACDRAAEERNRIHTEVKAENDKARRIFVEAIEVRRQIVAANDAERRRLTAEIETIRSRAGEVERQKAEADRALESAQARLSGLTDALPVNVVEAEAEIASLGETIASCASALKTLQATEALHAEMTAMIREIDALTASQTVFGAVEWALKRLRDEDMASRTGPLIDRMRRLLNAAGREEEPFLRCEKGQASFGWRTSAGEDVAVEALSGGQAVLFRAAIAYAIVCAREPEVRVLLVELAEASDGTTERDVLQALLEVSDEIQVIVASCVPVRAPEGWTVVEVVPEAVAVTKEMVA